MVYDWNAYFHRLFSYDSLIKLLVLVIVVYATFLVLAHQDSGFSEPFAPKQLRVVLG